MKNYDLSESLKMFKTIVNNDIVAIEWLMAIAKVIFKSLVKIAYSKNNTKQAIKEIVFIRIGFSYQIL